MKETKLNASFRNGEGNTYLSKCIFMGTLNKEIQNVSHTKCTKFTI